MERSRRFGSPRYLVTLLGATLVVAGAGVALARTSSGPPWAQESPSEVGKRVENDLLAVGNDCGTAVLGTADLSNADTTKAFDALVTALDSGQKDHMVQSVRVLMANCAARPNDGLKNALYHHGLNWVRHYEHEQWLQQKFPDKWPDGKPGKSDTAGGKPETAGGKPDKIHGNPHDLTGDTSGGQGHENESRLRSVIATGGASPLRSAGSATQSLT